MKNIIENFTNTASDKFIINIFKGVLISILITLFFLLVLSAILTYTNISETVIPVSIIVITAVSILMGSLLTTKRMKKKGMLYGGVIGVIYIILIYIVSSLISKGFGLNVYSILMIIFSIIAGMFGGILGINMN